MEVKNARLRELDFLRGIAIILVLLRHQYLFEWGHTMGWMGVDLFFVLSGFLVSGLLFKEYLKYGNIKSRLFLIRRGFKIYPIFFLVYPLYLVPKFIKHNHDWKGLFSEVFFVQNYYWGWGYANVASWSLAVEEHFYIGFLILLWFGLRNKFFIFRKDLGNHGISRFEIAILAIMVLCFCLRIVHNVCNLNIGPKNVTMTHLRMDSLFAGVLISYFFYFRNAGLAFFFNKHKTLLLLTAFLLLGFTPFVEHESFFVKTIGFSMLYISFGILLLYFLIEENINKKLNNIFTSPVVNIVSKIGFSSYSIYIIHPLVNYVFGIGNLLILHNSLDQTFIFVVTTTINVVMGILMTQYVEQYFLNKRNRLYPSRIN